MDFKNLILTALIVISVQFSYSKSIHDPIPITDANLKTALMGHQMLDGNKDGKISYYEANGYGEALWLNGKGISNISGLEEFKKTPSIHIENNNISGVVDFSGLPKLKILVCSDNQISGLKLNTDNGFTSVVCRNNKITSLDLPNTGLIRASGNPLTSINTSRCTGTTEIDIQNTQITSIDLSNMSKLRVINLNNNKLTSVGNVSSSSLSSFNISNNKLTELRIKLSGFLFDKLDCSNNKIETLELYKYIKQLDCSNNEITNFIKTGGNLSKITTANCSNNRLSLLELWEIKGGASALTNFNYSNQKPITNSVGNNHETLTPYSCTVPASLNGHATVYTMYKGTSVATNTDVEKIANGKYKFLTAGNYHYTCTNPAIPGAISTIYINVVENNKEFQTINIGTIPDYIEFGQTISFNATASSNLPLVYTASSADCQIIGNQIKFTKKGNYNIFVNQAGNSQYNPAPQVSFTVTVSKKKQQLTLGEIPENIYVNEQIRIYTRLNSDLDIVSRIEPSEGVKLNYQFDKQWITFPKDGNYQLILNQSGNDEFAAMEEKIINLYVKKQTQIVKLSYPNKVPTDILIDKEFDVPVSFQSAEWIKPKFDIYPDTYVLDEVNKDLTLTKAGTYTVKVYNDGSDNFYPIDTIFYITAHKHNQKIKASISYDKIVNQGNTINIDATSPLDPEFTVSPNTYEINNSGRYLFKKVGEYTIHAWQNGNYKYNAVDTLIKFNIGKGKQTLTNYASYPKKGKVSDTIKFDMKTSIGYRPQISFSPNTYTNIDNQKIIFHKEGSYQLTAQHPGDENFNASNSICYEFVVSKKKQEFSNVGCTGNKFVLDTLTLHAETNASNISPIFSLKDPSTGKIFDNNKVIFNKGAVSHIVQINAEGNDTYQKAETKNYSIYIKKLSQTVSVASFDTQGFVNTPMEINYGTSAKNREVNVLVNKLGTDYSIDNNIFTFHKSGTYSLQFVQPGDAIYEKSNTIYKNITINKKLQSITKGIVPSKVELNVPTKIEFFSADPSLQLEYTLPSGCTRNGNMFTFSEKGTKSIIINQAGNDEYQKADELTVGFEVFERIEQNGQTISVSGIPKISKVNAPININATASSGLPVIYTATPNSYEIKDGVLKFKKTGSYTLKINQPGNEYYKPATEKTFDISVGKNIQEISINEIPENLGYNTVIKFNASTSAVDLKVKYSVNSDDCLVNGSEITFYKEGTYTITVSQNGDDRYLAANSKTFEVTITRKIQKLNFTSVPEKYFVGQDYTFRVINSASIALDCKVEPNVSFTHPNIYDYHVNFSEKGTYKITFFNEGNNDYAPVKKVFIAEVKKKTQNINVIWSNIPTETFVNQKVPFYITTSPIKDTLLVTPSSYEYDANHKIKFTKEGNYTLKVYNNGNEFYEPIDTIFHIRANKRKQTLHFYTSYGNQVAKHIKVNASSNSNLELDCDISPKTYTIRESDGRINFQKAGEYTATCSQAGNDEYFPLDSMVKFTIEKGDQEIVNYASYPKSGYVNDSIVFDMTTNKGNPVEIEISPKTYTKVGNKILFHKPTKYTYKLFHSGNDDYKPADTLTLQFEAKRKNKILIVGSYQSSIKYGETVEFNAKTNIEGEEVIYSVADTVGVVNGNYISFNKAGKHKVAIYSPETDEYNATSKKYVNIYVNKFNQDITVSGIPSVMYVNNTIPIVASSNSGLKVQLSSNRKDDVAITNKGFIFHKYGAYTLYFTQEGNEKYNSKTISKTITITKKPNKITLGYIPKKVLVNKPIVFDIETIEKGMELIYDLPGDVTAKGDTITFTSSNKTRTINVRQNGNDEYEVAPAVQFSVEVVDQIVKQNQEIIVENVQSEVEIETPIQFNCKSSVENLKLTYSVEPNTCTLDGKFITFHEFGEYTIKVNQMGNDEYNPAVEKSFKVSIIKKKQNIDIGFVPSFIKVLDTIEFNASSSVETLNVIYSVEPNNCDIDGNKIVFNSGGEFTVKLNQPGNDKVKPAIEQSFTVNVNKLEQEIVIGNYQAEVDPNMEIEFNATTNAKSLEVEYSVEPNNCTIDGNKISFHKGGDYVVKMNQRGSDIYAAASERVINVKVIKVSQEILIGNVLKEYKVMNPIVLDVKTTAVNHELDYQISPNTYHKKGDTIWFHKMGDYSVDLSQAGSETYFSAKPKTLELNVVKNSQQLISINIPSVVEANVATLFNVKSSIDTLSIEFEVSPNRCKIDGNKITFLEAGNYGVVARQKGDDTYEMALESFVVNVTDFLTGIDNNYLAGVKVYPNPAVDYLKLKFKEIDSYQISIYNLQGTRLLYTTTTELTENIDISSLKNGTFILELKSEKGVKVLKFIKVE